MLVTESSLPSARVPLQITRKAKRNDSDTIPAAYPTLTLTRTTRPLLQFKLSFDHGQQVTCERQLMHFGLGQLICSSRLFYVL
jgi:hypothetical protein